MGFVARILAVVAVFLTGHVFVISGSAGSDRNALGLAGQVRSLTEQNNGGTGSQALVVKWEFDRFGYEIGVYSGRGSVSGSFEVELRSIPEYDSRGNKIMLTEYRADGSVSAITRFAYDENDRQVIEASYDFSGAFTILAKGALKNLKMYWYDGDGRVTRIVRSSVFMPSGLHRTEYIYDAQGGKCEVTYSSDGKVATQCYVNGLVVQGLERDRDGVVLTKTDYTYDGHGNEVSMTRRRADDRLDQKITYDYEYDRFGNWSKRTMRWLVKDGGNSVEPNSVTHRTITYYEPDAPHDGHD